VSAVALATAALAFLLAACAERFSTPEEFWTEYLRRHAAGDHRGTWALFSAEGRTFFCEQIDRSRETLRRNPGTEKLATQFQVTPEEFLSLPYDEIWRRSNRNTEKVLEGSRIVQKATDPRRPDVTALDVETRYGQKFRFSIVQDAERGWLFLRGDALKLE
jgi:hypothetical protein